MGTYQQKNHKSGDVELKGMTTFEWKLERKFETSKKKAYEKGEEFYFHLRDWEKTADLFEKRAEYLYAAYMYQKAKNFQKANENFERVAKSFEKKGLYPEAAYIYAKSGRFEKAAWNLETMYLYSRETFYFGKHDERISDYLTSAVDFYLRINDAEKACRLLILGERYSRAAELLIESGKLEEAVQLLEKVNLPLEAADVYERLGECKKANLLRAEVALNESDTAKAAMLYRKAGDFVMAASLFENSSLWKDAAECYCMAKHYQLAAECYLKASLKKEACEVFEWAGDLKNAADILVELEEFKKAGLFYEKCGLYYNAANAFLRGEASRKALINFQKVPENSENYYDSVIHITDYFLECENFELVIQKLEKLKESDLPAAIKARLLYNLARAHENNTDFEKATKIYKRILEYDFFFKDVKDRMGDVERLNKKLKLMEKERIDPGKRYKLKEEIGEGGMGIVYKAEDIYLGRIVAIKILNEKLSKEETANIRFYNEAKAVASLSHPGIVKVFEFGELNGDYFILMEYLEGEDINSILKSKKIFSIQQIVIIAKKIVKALYYAHQRGVIHRDIKPHNIMITRGHELKIMDFGIAYMKGDEGFNDEECLTGTPYYMSPEQIRGEAIDLRADIYSIGVTLFHIITGDVPFKGKDILKQHLFSKEPPISKMRSSVPAILVEIVTKCMEKKPKDRYQSAIQIYEELKKIQINELVRDEWEVQDSEIQTELIGDIINFEENGDDTPTQTPTEVISSPIEKKRVEAPDSSIFKKVVSSKQFDEEGTFNRGDKTFKRGERTVLRVPKR